MYRTQEQFRIASTYDEIETATDALLAGEVSSIKINSDLVDKPYMASLSMAILGELPCSLRDDEHARYQNGDTIIKKIGSVSVSCEDNFHIMKID